MSSPLRLQGVLGRPVLVCDEVVGHVRGVFLDGTGSRPIGLEVVSPGRTNRFLPWVAAKLDGGALVAASAFLLFDSCEPYLERGAVLCREADELDRLSEPDVLQTLVVGTAVV